MLLTEWQAQKGVHGPCVSALAEWAISVSSSFTAVSELAPPTRCLLDEGLGWHLSVSGRPSVAPSISLADSPGPGASLTPSLHQLYATLPALAWGLSAVQAHECKLSHILAESHSPWTCQKVVIRSWGSGRAPPWQLDTQAYARTPHSLLLFVFNSFLSSVLSFYFICSCITFSSRPLPSCPLRSMVNSCRTWLWDW